MINQLDDSPPSAAIGSFESRSSTGPGFSVASPDTVHNALTLARGQPHTPVRRVAHYLRLLKSTVHRILQREKFHPYKFQIVQILSDTDKFMRLKFCQWFIEEQRSTPSLARAILFTDELILIEWSRQSAQLASVGPIISPLDTRYSPPVGPVNHGLVWNARRTTHRPIFLRRKRDR